MVGCDNQEVSFLFLSFVCTNRNFRKKLERILCTCYTDHELF